MSSPEESSDRIVGRTRKCCSFKYRIRWFHSKGAALVLLWFILGNVSSTILYNFYPKLASVLIPKDSNRWILDVVMGILFLVCAPLSGWLADARLGNYRVFRTGFMFLFFASVMVCVGVLVLENVPANNYASLVLSAVIVPIVYLLTSAGTVACFVSTLQLGLDQMPDASTVNTTSFISWFVCCILAALWIGNASHWVLPYCLEQYSFCYDSCVLQISSLFPVLCMALALFSDILLSPEWLIIEPKSPQSLKLIYQVLKFAAKHKAPVNRSALTYWEEDIPSRIDLGKSKYGGPFTTEQVEDVKTIFKLLVVFVPFFLISLSLSLLGGYSTFTVSPESVVLYYFTYNIYWCAIIGTLVFEFVIYPFVRDRLPSILRRIGAASFLVVVLNIVSLVVSVVRHYDSSVNITVVFVTVLQVMSGLLTTILLPATVEFVCAQSPYSMRALVTGNAVFLCMSPVLLGTLVHVVIFHYFGNVSYCSIIYYTISTSLGIVGFLLHCILARWYKRRVRDDVYTPHRLVEEVYDRYLSART